MKYIKMLGLAAVAAAALMALVGPSSASAATLTDSSGKHLPIGTTIAATSTHGILTNGAITVTCTHSLVEGTTTTTGGGVPTETVKGHITYLDFTNCGSWTVTVVKPGTLEVHSLGNGNGTVTSTGAEVTLAGLGLHCVFTTNNTDIGEITGSKNRGGATALFDINGQIPRTGGKSGVFCGGTGTWTGSYTVIGPDYLDID